MVKEKRSPLKEKPLRNPGQSVQGEIEKVYDSDVLDSLFMIAILTSMATMAWMQFLFKIPAYNSAVIMTICFVIGSTYYIRKLVKARKEIKRLKMARDGERDVAEYLNDLRENGCHILHDLPGKGFNIDHIIVAKKGIFAVETKTFSKSIEKDEIIVFNGKTIQIGDYQNTEIIKQAEIERSSLKKIIEEATGKTFHIKSVVTFPGWFIKHTGRDEHKNLFVFNPNYFVKFVQQQPETLSDEDIKLIVVQLEKYIRNFVES